MQGVSVEALQRKSLPRENPSSGLDDVELPLSYQQEYLLHLMQRAPGWNFLTALAWRLQGILQPEALCRTLDAIVGRHESLRTRILTSPGKRIQKVDAPYQAGLDILLCTGSADRTVMEEAREKVAHLFESTLDPSGRICRSTLVRLAEDDHVLVILIHHLQTDGVSAGTLFRELWAHYRCLIEGREAAFAKKPLQYGQYARAQRARAEDWLRDHRSYWTERLHGAQPARPFRAPDSTETARPDILQSMHFSVDEALSASLLRLAQSERLAPAMILLTAYACTVAAWSGTRDVVIPVHVTGRQSTLEMTCLGYFHQVIPLRIQLEAGQRFRELLRTIAADFLEAHMHLDSGRALLEAPHLMSGTHFNWLSSHPGELSEHITDADGRTILSVTPFSADHEERRNELNNDLYLLLWNTANGIRGLVQTEARRVTSGEAAQFLRKFRETLTRVGRNADETTHRLVSH